ncbi:unnamed protein product, partial [Ectocarpus sp. 12 AP-2014]
GKVRPQPLNPHVVPLCKQGNSQMTQFFYGGYGMHLTLGEEFFHGGASPSALVTVFFADAAVQLPGRQYGNSGNDKQAAHVFVGIGHLKRGTASPLSRHAQQRRRGMAACG